MVRLSLAGVPTVILLLRYLATDMQLSVDFREFLGFPKVKWQHLTGEVDISVRGRVVKFSQDSTYQKLLKSVTFRQSYSKNKKMDVFDTQGRPEKS